MPTERENMRQVILGGTCKGVPPALCKTQRARPAPNINAAGPAANINAAKPAAASGCHTDDRSA